MRDPNTTPRQHMWIAGLAHWGEADIYFFCDESEWDGNLRVNGNPAIRVADYMDANEARGIVAHHNKEVSL